MLRQFSKSLLDASRSQVGHCSELTDAGKRFPTDSDVYEQATESAIVKTLTGARHSLQSLSVSSTAAATQGQGVETSSLNHKASGSTKLSSAATVAALPTQATWSDVPTPAKLLGLGGTLRNCMANPFCMPLHNEVAKRCNAGNLQVLLNTSRCDSFHSPFSSHCCKLATAAS